ncbi:PTC4 [Candida pseudojiufengensis]|uniref:PTC4 n=1 Tax=Candida pseudojiufengensis TaxID=497109 RepID=UPI00222532D1|nr:PTC4 [Candida pseudojiufengensis]KAI5962579.1 PTC4 [Candida pseudojiufengensis]
MGQLLSHPIEEKELDYKIHTRLSYCVGSMQGYRMTMEDAHGIRINEDETVAVFGVFDGHGGKQCSEYVAEHLPKAIFKQLLHLKDETENKEREGNERSKENGQLKSNKVSTMNQKVFKILKNAFFKIDHDLSHHQGMVNCGSTSILCAIIDNKIYVANTGDSRCILSTNQGCAKTLSFDQKPSLIGERVRIENSNGYVINNRINEILALSRAIGDFKFKTPYLTSTLNKFVIRNKENFYKQQNNNIQSDEKPRLLSKHSQTDQDYIHIPPELFQVTVEPDILIYDLKVLPEPEFIVIACDGIWDCFKNDQLIKLIRDKIVLGWKLNKIIEYILNDTLTMANNYTGIGFDNMTLLIIALHPKTSLEDWYNEMIFKIEKEKGLH